MAAQLNESKASAPLGAAVFAILLSAIFVALRLYTRIHVKKPLWVDDYFTIVSFCVILGAGVAIGMMTRFGLGKHIDTVAGYDILLHKRARFVATALYTVGLFTIKMTFLLQYLRVLGDDWRTYRKFLASILLIGLWAMSEFWVNVFICIPVEGAWNSNISSSCIPNGPYQYVYISMDIISAVAIFLFPIMFMRHLVIGWPEAIVLAVVFTLGLFVVVLQFVRLHYVNLGNDFTWKFADRVSLMISELAVALLCTCVPLLHPLAERLFPRWFCTFSFDKSDQEHIKPSWPGEMEKSHQTHHDVTMGTQGASGSSFGFGFGFETGSRQKNRNHTPRDGLDDIRPAPRRDDSGDLSDDVMGLQSALRGMKRVSFNRSLSEGNVSRSSQQRNEREQARQSPRPGMNRTQTSPQLYSPTRRHHGSVSPADAQLNPTVVVRQPPSMMHTKARLAPAPAPFVIPPRRGSVDYGNDTGALREHASGHQRRQQQQQYHHQQHEDYGTPSHGALNTRSTSNHVLFHDSVPHSQPASNNKQLPKLPGHNTGVGGYDKNCSWQQNPDRQTFY